MWSHFHHKSLWHSSVPSPSPVVSLQTLYQRKEKTSYRCSLSLLSHQHTWPHHPLSSTHVYASWTHITINHSKLTTHWVVLRGLVEKTIVRPFSPGGSVQFSFLLWIPITLGQARFQALELWNIFGNLVTDFFSFFWIYEHLLRSFPDNTGVANELVLLESVRQVIRWYIAIPVPKMALLVPKSKY